MTPEPQPTAPPTPALLFDTLNAHQRTEAIKTGIELGLFTEIAHGKTTAAEIAKACDASEKLGFCRCIVSDPQPVWTNFS